MKIRTKTRDPKPSDFSKQELIINILEGSLFYKSNLGVHKLVPSSTTTGTGAQGAQGIQGVQGPQGDPGPQGDSYFNDIDNNTAATTSTNNITFDGNVGIGLNSTTTPTEKLEINGNFFLNVGDIRSSGDLNLITDDTVPHAEDQAFINIKSTTAASDINGDLNVISNHTIAGDSLTAGTEAGNYAGTGGTQFIPFPACVPFGCTSGPGINVDTNDFSFGYFAASGVGNFTCEGDAAVGRFLSVGWNTAGGTASGVSIPSLMPLGSITALGNVYAAGTSLTSDIKLKKNIKPIKDSLNKILSLEGKNYEWKDKTKPGKQYGLIAQDVEKVIPELVTQGKTKHLDYTSIIPILIEAIKDQQEQINKLKNIIDNA